MQWALCASLYLVPATRPLLQLCLLWKLPLPPPLLLLSPRMLEELLAVLVLALGQGQGSRWLLHHLLLVLLVRGQVAAPP